MIYETNYYVGSDLNGDSLAHHGVPHQKWGVTNGPPYPIQRGKETHYNVGKMTSKTKEMLTKTGKITTGGAKAVGKAVGKAANTVGGKVKSSFQRWKENTKAELVVKDTNSKLVKNWQKKQLRISDMTNQELQQRIDRKKLEETYKHALRGDFSDPKTWNKSAKDAKSSAGKSAAGKILTTFGDAAVNGLAKGLSSRLEYKMTEKAKRRVERREARRDAIAEVMRDAAKERKQYKAEQKNEAWKERQEQKRQRRESTRYDDGAMDATTGYARRSNYSYGALGSGSGRPTGTYYYAGPNEGSVR